MTIGRLVARKNIHHLIAVMERLKYERARLLIMGTGPLSDTLKAEAEKRQVADRVVFLGHVDEAEKFRLLHMSDIFVSTSGHEGFGLVFLEAMACRLPIVCYNHGGQTDFLTDGQTGHLVSLDDVDTFTERTLSLMQDPARRKAIGEENQQRVEEYYIDNHAQRYENVFSQAIEIQIQRKSTKMAVS
jgi:glycosyltransferase involved in cell wall biosynthesis